MYTYNHWITDIEQPTTAKAFTYTIWFPLLGLRYIGYKSINGGKNWIEYTSSSKPTNKLISKGNTAVYRIVKWFNDIDDARAEEVSVMTSYDVTHRSEFLNQCIGGVKFGGAISDETRAKMSVSKKGKTLSDETRAKMSISRKARPPISDETRAKLSKASKNKSAEHRAKISASNKNRVYTNKTREKLREANLIGLYITPLGIFKTTYDAAIAYKCNASTISRRCKSTSPQFKDWYFQPK